MESTKQYLRTRKGKSEQADWEGESLLREQLTQSWVSCVVYFSFHSPSLDFRAAQIMELLLGLGGLKAKRNFSQTQRYWEGWGSLPDGECGRSPLGFVFPFIFLFLLFSFSFYTAGLAPWQGSYKCVQIENTGMPQRVCEFGSQSSQ